MRKVLVAVFGACVLALCLGAQAAQAQGSVTLCTADMFPSQCKAYGKIQEAIDATKTMRGSTNFVIKLTNGIYTETLVVGEDLAGNNYTILGQDPQETIIQADGSPCDPGGSSKSDKRVLKIMGPAVRLENLTIQHGCLRDDSTSVAGAGVWSSGTLTLRRVVVVTNTLEYTGTDSVPAMGGGIYSSGALEIDSSSIMNNKAITGGTRAYGGGIYSRGSTRIVNSTITHNAAFSRNDVVPEPDTTGGGIYAERALDAAFNTITFNEAGLVGGGLVGIGDPVLEGNLFFSNNGLGTGDPSKEFICLSIGSPLPPPGCKVTYPRYVNLGALRYDYTVPLYRPLLDSKTIDAADCVPAIIVDQVGDKRGVGNKCDMGASENGATYLPSLVVQPPMADLSVVAINIKPQGELNSTTPVVLEVVIQNTGMAEAKRGFWVDLFINPISEPPNQAGTVWSDLCRSAGCIDDLGISWYVATNLLPGEKLTLTSQRMTDPYIYLPKTHWNNTLNAGDVMMWAYVDSWNGRNVPWGWVGEIIETNNRGGPVSRNVPVGKPQYPFSAAQFPAIESDRPANN